VISEKDCWVCGYRYSNNVCDDCDNSGHDKMDYIHDALIEIRDEAKKNPQNIWFWRVAEEAILKINKNKKKVVKDWDDKAKLNLEVHLGVAILDSKVMDVKNEKYAPLLKSLVGAMNYYVPQVYLKKYKYDNKESKDEVKPNGWVVGDKFYKTESFRSESLFNSRLTAIPVYFYPLLNEDNVVGNLSKVFKEIMDYQMDYVQLARTTDVYKLAENGMSILSTLPISDNKEGKELSQITCGNPCEELRTACFKCKEDYNKWTGNNTAIDAK